MTNRKNLRLLTLVALSILLVIPAASYAGQLFGNHSLSSGIHPVAGQGTSNILGIDCAYGSNLEGVPFPASVITPAPYSSSDFDGTLDTSCQATYLADTDGALHPLVSDNPTAVATGGGGFTVDVVTELIAGQVMNGFDVSLQFNTKQLQAVGFDQSGLAFGGVGLPSGAFVLGLAKTIDNTGGTVRLAQVIVNAPQSGTVELFRMRFDVVGSSSAALSCPAGAPNPTASICIFNDVLTSPSSIAHTTQSLTTLDTQAIYDTLNAATLGFVDNWTFSPNPEVPGSSLTFSAASASCISPCAGPFTYNWDFSSSDAPTYVPKISATGQSALVTAPPPVINRVTLTVTDSAAHSFALTRILPLALVESPSTSSLTAGTAGPAGGFTAKWLGGVVTATAGYAGSWRFCPGSAITTTVCSSPAPGISQAPTAVTQIATVASETYHFAGVYNDTVQIHSAAGTEQQLGFTADTLTAIFLTNVGGTPQAYTVTVAANPTSPTVGQSVTFTASVAYAATYPAGFQSTTFNYKFDFGDGSAPSMVSGGTSVTTTHTFNSGASFTVFVTAQETGAAAVSKIQETGSTLVTVTSGFTYTVAASPATLSITQGGAPATETLSAALVTGTAAPVTFSLSALPTGVSVVFTPNPPTCTPSPSPCSISADFTASSTATSGTSTITVTGTSGTTTQTASFTLTVVVAAFAFTVQAAPATLSITQGGSAGIETLSATLTAGVAAPVTFSLSALPSGVSVVFTPNPPTCTPSPSPCSVSAAFTASPTAATGTTTITVTGTSGTTTATTTFSLTVLATTFALTVQAAPATLSITQGGAAGTETLSATLTAGVASPVTFSLSALPSGVSVVFTPNPPTCTPNCSVSAAFTATPTATTGTTTITVTGTSGTTTATTTFSVTVVATTFTFAVQAAPATLSITQGGVAGIETLSATLTAGAAAPVTFSLSTLPTGVSVTFTPSPATCTPSPSPCSVSAALTASPIATTGTSTITVTGTSGATTATTTFSLTVVATTLAFAVQATPATLSITQGGAAGTETLSATLTAGVPALVTFSLSTLPSGVSVVFTPNPPTCTINCSVSVAFTATSTAATGTTTITVTGTSGSTTATTTFSLTVASTGFTFTVQAAPATLSINQGGASASETLSATLTAGIAAPVTFSLSTLPSGVSVVFTPNPPTCTPNCSVSAAFSATPTATTGTSTITVTGTSGSTTATTTFSLTVVATTFAFTVQATPATLSITQGGVAGTETLSATLTAGVAAPLTFSLSALPSGVSVVFTPNPPTCTPNCSVSAAFTASATTTVGATTVTVTGTSGSTTATTTFSLNVVATGFAFTVQAAPASVSITQGGASATETLSATLTAGVAAPVTFSLSTLPTGVSVVFTPNPPTCTPNCSVSAAFTASNTAVTGTSTITVTGTSGTTTATTTFSLTVLATTFAFTVQATPATLSIAQGGASSSETLSATLTAGVAAPVTFSLSTLPTGVSVVFTPNPPTCTPNCSVSAAFTASPTATFGTTTITVTGTSGSTTATTTFSLTVVSVSFAFTIQATPATQSITQGGASATETLSATITAGTAAPVTFSLSALPSGVSVVFTPNPPTCTPNCSVSAVLTASPTAATGTTTITVTGTSGTTTGTTTFSLAVVATTLAFTVQATPASLSITQGGVAGTETLSATLTAGVAAPLTFSLSALPSGVSVIFTPNPPTCTPDCNVSAAFSASATATTGTTTVTVTGSSGTTTASTTFSLTVVAAAFDFTLSAPSPGSLTVTQGGASQSSVITASLVAGVTTPVTFSITSVLPAGVFAIFTNNPCSPTCTVTVSFSANASATLGTTSVSINASGGGATHSATLSLTVQAPVSIPVVTVNSPTPNPANTGQMVTVTFAVSSTGTVTGIMVSWGDGTTPDALSGTATSDTHVYASTGNAKSENFTITVTATNSAGSGSGSTFEAIIDRPPVVTISNVSPNPAHRGQIVTVTFSATDPDGTISSFSVNWGDSATSDSLPGTATSDTHMYNVTGTFTITVTATDNSGSTGSATTTETVTAVTVTPVTLTFQAQAPQSPGRGPGLIQVFVNGQHVVDVTPGTINFTSFGPIDITAFIIFGGQNSITFVNPQTNQFDLVKNDTITQGSATLLHVNKARSIAPGSSLTDTFSVPALVLTSFTASSTSLVVGQETTFTATFTGGTPRFKCTFQFGDGESSSVIVNSGTCSASHDYDHQGNFRAKVLVLGSSISDRVSASIKVVVGHACEDDD